MWVFFMWRWAAPLWPNISMSISVLRRVGRLPDGELSRSLPRRLPLLPAAVSPPMDAAHCHFTGGIRGAMRDMEPARLTMHRFIDGVFVSRDGGQTWTAGAGLSSDGPLTVSLLVEDRITNLAGYLA